MNWERLWLTPFVLLAVLVGAGTAVGLGFSIGHGLAGVIVASSLIAILYRIRSGDWVYMLLILLAPALIGEVLGAGVAILFGFNMGLGLVGGGIVVVALVSLMMALRPWYGEGLPCAIQVFLLVPMAGIIGAVIAIIIGSDIKHGVVGGASVLSILALLIWIGFFFKSFQPGWTSDDNE